MKSRFLHLILSLLILVSAPVGMNVQTAVIDSSNDVKVVSVYSSAQELNPVFVSEAKSFERTVVRSQKKSASSEQKAFNVDLFSKADFSFSIFSFSSTTQTSSRVLLLPKSLQTIIFLQTVI
ncbi:hypothetical protein [Treponema sp.]|uniref:hypothetical protein n=1 Tax=Treponema sp. TaxID=166 RepID=UPI00388D99EC